MRTCYICGRDFGSSSLSIHEPQCMKKWEAEMELLPPAERRPRPVRPDVGEHASVAEQNDAAYEAHETNLSPCPNCGRTFNPKSLQVHLRSCGGSHGTSKPVHGKTVAHGATGSRGSAVRTRHALFGSVCMLIGPRETGVASS